MGIETDFLPIVYFEQAALTVLSLCFTADVAHNRRFAYRQYNGLISAGMTRLSYSLRLNGYLKMSFRKGKL